MISTRFVLKRLLLLVPVLVGVASLVFSILHLSPGDPALTIAGRERRPTARTERDDARTSAAALGTVTGLLADAARFEFGESFIIAAGTASARSSRTSCRSRSNSLSTASVGILLGLPLGIISAVKQDALTDHVTRIGR